MLWESRLVFGFFGTVININQSWPIYKELYRIGFKKDPFAIYSLELTKNNTIIHLRGGFGFGISDDILDILKANKSVEGIVLDSIGGRIYEGRKLSELILNYGLNTYSLIGCYSACTTAFIAGKNRYLGTGANLAFHQYNMGYKNLSKVLDIKKEQEADLQIFKQQGINNDFLDKLFNTPHDDLWYPPLDEMLMAGVVHDIVNPSDISPLKYKVSLFDFDKAFLDIHAYKIIKKYAPDTYQKLLLTIDAHIKKGASEIELQHEVAKHIKTIAFKVMAKSSDEALIEFTKVLVDKLRKLKEKDPILCLKSLFPQEYGPVNFSKYQNTDDGSFLMDALGKIIEDAYERDNPPIDPKAAESVIEKIVLSLVEEAKYLDHRSLQTSVDYKRSCDAFIKFYEVILAEEKKESGNALRYAFSQK